MKVLRVVKIILMVVVAAFVMSYIVMRLWNWLMPEIFGLHVITWTQALGLLLLSKILLGGFHRHGGGKWKQRAWQRRMEKRWDKMTPEERERFRAGMRGRKCCSIPGFGPKEAEQTPQ